jgi:antitoxin ParD1/3/4
MTLNVSLTPHLEEFVRQSVNSGRFLSANDLVGTALRLLEEQERERSLRLEALQREIQKGLDSGPAALLDIDALVRECQQQSGTTQA